jgi:hypothetical protein
VEALILSSSSPPNSLRSGRLTISTSRDNQEEKKQGSPIRNRHRDEDTIFFPNYYHPADLVMLERVNRRLSTDAGKGAGSCSKDESNTGKPPLWLYISEYKNHHRAEDQKRTQQLKNKAKSDDSLRYQLDRIDIWDPLSSHCRRELGVRCLALLFISICFSEEDLIPESGM